MYTLLYKYYKYLNILHVNIYYSLFYFFFRFSEKTYSLWGYIWSRLDDFTNPLFDNGTEDYIMPKTEVSILRYVYNDYV